MRRRPRRVAPPPPIPPKSQLARTIGTKVNASRDATFDGEEGTTEDVYVVPGEPDIGGVDDYVDINPVSAWEQQNTSAGITHLTAEELAKDQCEESYVEMHPATTGLPPTEEEDEEEEDQPCLLYTSPSPRD